MNVLGRPDFSVEFYGKREITICPITLYVLILQKFVFRENIENLFFILKAFFKRPLTNDHAFVIKFNFVF